MWQALLGAGLEFAGGFVANQRNRKLQHRQEKLQKEFAQHGIRWKVEDAKAAGLHPLFALGGQGASYTPTIVPDSLGPAMASAGQSISRAVAATQTQYERELAQANLELIKAQTAETDARRGAILSEQRRQSLAELHSFFPEVNTGSSSISSMTPQGVVMPEGQVPTGLQTVKPGESIIPSATDPGIGANRNPAMGMFTLPGGLPVLLPSTSSDPAEALETLAESPLLMYAVYRMNVEKFGKEWGRQFMRRYFPAGKALDFLFHGSDTLHSPRRMPGPARSYVPYEGY